MTELALSIPGYTIQAPQGIASYSFDGLLQFGVTSLFVIAVLLSLVFLVLGGIDIITSGGEKQKIVNARHKLTYAIVGMIIVFLSLFIIKTIGGVFGVNLFPTTGTECIGNECITP